MPTYPYQCDKCDQEYEVIKSIRDYDGKDACPDCGNIGTRIPCAPVFYGEKVQNAEYNPGLGKVVRNSYHRSELCKQMNVVEIGNEKPETVHRTFDKQREEKRQKVWDEA